MTKEKQSEYAVTGLIFYHSTRSVAIRTDTKENIETKRMIAELKDELVYTGLDVKYIDYSKLGAHDRVNSTTGAYEWLSNDGKYAVLSVSVSDGKITSVEKNYEDIYWNDPNNPDLSADKDEIDAERERAAVQEEQQITRSGSSQSGSDRMVWIPRTGAKYHSRSNCSNMKNPSQVTEDEAIAMGYERCKKCW